MPATPSGARGGEATLEVLIPGGEEYDLSTLPEEV
jgi:hypothetical protein